MKKTLALIILMFGLAACGHGPSSSAGVAADATPPPPAASSTADSAAASASTASSPVSTGALNAAASTQESAGTGATDSGDNSLERVASLPPQAQLPSGRWVAGTNYTVLSPAQPTDEPPGKVQVVEVFWYGCPHCYALDPYLQAWLKSKPDYVDFVRVPVMWGDVHRAHARLFYTLQALGKLDELHSKAFDEIHLHNDMLFVQGDDKATFNEQLKFAVANGISAQAFTAAWNSFGVQTDLQKADELDRRYRIDGVPTIIIDGKYESDVQMAGGDQQLVQLIGDLAASEKRQSG